jgi:hypothetical protein
MLLAGLFGLAMSVCGGGFTVDAVLATLHPGKGDELAPLALIVSVPSLLIGMLVVALIWRRWRHVRRIGQN